MDKPKYTIKDLKWRRLEHHRRESDKGGEKAVTVIGNYYVSKNSWTFSRGGVASEFSYFKSKAEGKRQAQAHYEEQMAQGLDKMEEGK